MNPIYPKARVIARAARTAAAGHSRAWFHALLAGALLGWCFAVPAEIAAQVPAAPAQAPPPAARAGDQFLRVVFFDFSQFAYKVHPFLQITGDADFNNGDAASAISNFSTPATASDENIVFKGIHTLPAFGIETGAIVDLYVLKAVSIGFDYTRFSQTDKAALDTTKSVVTIPRIQMDSYYYSIFARGYAFPANEPGMNFYLGFGLGLLEGKFDAIPFAGANKSRHSFSQSPIGMTQFGVEALGENFGVRYEVRVVRARKVGLDENPYLNQSAVTSIDYSGTMIKISAFYQF